MDLLKVNEAAELLRVTPKTIKRWIKANKIQAVFISSRWYVHKREVDKLIENGMR